MPFTSNGPVRIWWDEHGQGEPALLVMGHSYGSIMWHRAVQGLSGKHRLLTFDNRGVGHSDAPGGAYSIAEMAADGIAVMDAAGVTRCHVYGVSLGGLIAEELALAYADRVRSLVLGCTGCIEPEDNTSRLPFWLQKFLLRVLVRIRIHLPNRADKHYGPGTPDQVRAEDLQLLRTTRRTAQGLIGQALAGGTYSSRRRLASVTTPTLVLHGDDDQIVPVDKGKELASVIQGARFELLPGAGHNYLTSPDGAANQLVLDFWHQVESDR